MRNLSKGQVTLVLPNYNHARFLEESIGNALHQTRPADRILIIDDASTDNSVDLIKSLIRGYPNAQLIIHEKNKGCIPTLSEGLAAVETEFVAFPGADDRLERDYLEKSLPFLESYPEAAFCSGASHIINEKGAFQAIRPLFLPAHQAAFIPPAQVKRLLRDYDNFFLAQTAIYRTKYLLDIGGLRSSLGFLADGMMLREAALRYGFCFLPDVLASWRFIGENRSVTTISDNEYLENLIHHTKIYLSEQPQGLFPHNYAELLEKRLRFSAARVKINKAGSFEAAELTNLLQAIRSPIEARSLSYITNHLKLKIAKLLLLTYSYCLTRPFKILPLIKGLLCRSIYLGRLLPGKN